jgi:hypothetical protein
MAAASASSPCGCDLATNEDAQQTLLPFQANAAASFRMDARERLASLALALPRGLQPPGRPTDVLSQMPSLQRPHSHRQHLTQLDYGAGSVPSNANTLTTRWIRLSRPQDSHTLTHRPVAGRMPALRQLTA